jgi:hypothetical protein
VVVEVFQVVSEVLTLQLARCMIRGKMRRVERSSAAAAAAAAAMLVS